MIGRVAMLLAILGALLGGAVAAAPRGGTDLEAELASVLEELRREYPDLANEVAGDTDARR